jgi:lipoprotein-releasing system ATP-binding protein
VLSDNERTRVRRHQMGFVYQFHQLLPEFSALENVAMPLLIAGESRDAASERAAADLGRVGLQDREDHRPGALSGGEQQRVAVARALVARPGLLLADEPSGNLDEATASDLHALIRDMHREHGLTSIIATHDPAMAAACDRTVRLEGGRLR